MGRNSRLILRVILLLLLPGVFLVCQSCDTRRKAERIDELVNRYHEFDKFNGCVLVAEGEDIIYENALGFSNVDKSEKLTPDHGFRLGSVAKQFTAMAVMILQEQGMLNYGDDIRQYIPELPYERVTVRHLLTHMSGLPDYTSLLEQYWDTMNIGLPARKIATNHDALNLLVKKQPPVEFNPGDRHKYCNTGFMLLALMVERISGQTFQAFMESNVFRPLGMNSTYVNDPSGILPGKQRAHGLELNREGTGFLPKDYHYQNGMYGDGGIISTVEDMFKWDQVLYSDGLVSESTLNQAFAPAILNDSSTVDYGFGWSIVPYEDGIAVAHGGGWLGFRAFILRDITAEKTIIQLCNMPGIRKGELAFTIWRILHNKEYTLPKRSIAEVMLQAIYRAGVEAAIEEYRELKETSPDKYHFSEGELNKLGYQLIGLGRVGDAIEVFKLNVDVFPDSWNVYDSLGEAYMIAGDVELAIAYYKKSLELKPDNTNAQQKLKKLKQE